MFSSLRLLNLATLLLLVSPGVPIFPPTLHAQTTPETAAPSQQERGKLELGKVTTATLQGEERHNYQIPLKKGQYLHLIVQQESLDLIVTLFDPTGQQILEVDGTGRSSELILAIAETSGNYRLQVRRYEQDALQIGFFYR